MANSERLGVSPRPGLWVKTPEGWVGQLVHAAPGSQSNEWAVMASERNGSVTMEYFYVTDLEPIEYNDE